MQRCMAQETTYGIISDIHENHAIIPRALDTLIALFEADKIKTYQDD